MPLPVIRQYPAEIRRRPTPSTYITLLPSSTFVVLDPTFSVL